MNFQIIMLRNIESVLDSVLKGKVEHLPQAKLVKRMIEDLIKYIEKEESINARSSL